MGAFFREPLVVGVFTDAVGMPTDPQLRAWGFFFQASGYHVEFGFIRRRQLGRVELKVHIANHDGLFLDHDNFLNHRCLHRRGWATVGVDLHPFRRAWALVAAVRHTIAVFVAITMYPAIGTGHAADQQRAIAGVRRTFCGANRGTGHTTDGCTGGPIGFLQTCATCQYSG